MQIELSKQEFRSLLDLVYIGNWVLNSTRGEDRFQVYDDLESKLFALCRENGMKVLVQDWEGIPRPLPGLCRRRYPRSHRFLRRQCILRNPG